MSITKIAVLVSASIVTAGSSAAVATRDKWCPKTAENADQDSEGDSQRIPNVQSLDNKAGTEGSKVNQAAPGTPPAKPNSSGIVN